VLVVDQVVAEQEAELLTPEELVVEILVAQQIQTLPQMVLVMMVVAIQGVVLQLMEQVVEVVLVLLEQVEHYLMVVDMVEQDFKFHQHSEIPYLQLH
tara:strand:+ start:683 stop:973 length:291 start_codon:yes stop_codon:yes gene_type:complete